MVSQWRYFILCLLGLLSLQMVATSPIASTTHLVKRVETNGETVPPTNNPPQQDPPQQIAPVQAVPQLSNAVPKVHPDVNSKKALKSYSGSGETSADGKTIAKTAFKDMSKQHKAAKQPFGSKPSIMGALKTPDNMAHIDSSIKGGFKAEEHKDPAHLTQKPTMDIYQACKDAYGGGHKTGGNCAELRNADSYFAKNPGATHIPESSEWETYGHPGGSKVQKEIPACTGSKDGEFGCRQFKDMAKTPVDQRPAKIEAIKQDREASKAAKGQAQQIPQNKFKRWIQETIEDELLNMLHQRALLFDVEDAF